MTGGPGAQLHGEVRNEHQLVRCPVGVAGHQLIQQRAVRLRHGGMQQRGGGDHQYTEALDVVSKEQAEVAVRHPARLQDLAEGVGAELRHWPRSRCWWMGGAAGYPAAHREIELLGARWSEPGRYARAWRATPVVPP